MAACASDNSYFALSSYPENSTINFYKAFSYLIRQKAINGKEILPIIRLNFGIIKLY